MWKLQAVLVGAAVIVTAALMTCRSAATDGAAADTSYRATPGYVVDSARPIEVDLARFREKLVPPPTGLTGGSNSFDGLVALFAKAVEGRDTAALQRMQVSAAEYGWLIYPESPLTKHPYQQAPQIAWMMLRQAGDVGLKRLLDRRGGSPLRIAGRVCDQQPVTEGENRIWRRCTVRTVAGRDTSSERLFGVVVERHGRFKFVSYQNQY